jgi:hypothetical protein
MNFDIDQFFADSYPVILSDSVTLAEGENKQMDVQALSNVFDTPMVIDEIRTQISLPDIDLQVANFGGSVRLQLTVGRYALSDTYIPVGCLGTMFDGGELDLTGITPQVYSPESTYGYIISDPTTVGYFRWKLPRPLVCPIGMPLQAKISRQVEGLSEIYPDTDPLTVNVSYAGRAAKKHLPPDITVPIPYVGFFENVFSSASVATSGQLDLYNPFQSPLTVQRLIGRWQNIYLDTGTPGDSWIGLDQSETSGSTSILFPSTQIRTFSGFFITNGFIPGQAIFEANTRSLPMNILLERSEGIEVIIDATAGIPSTGAQPTPTGSNTSLVTMIGWRNERL